jgi:alanyl-tRNA synthetase
MAMKEFSQKNSAAERTPGATGDIGSFKITSYESIASGTRRIYAVTGAGAFKRFQESDNIIADLTDNLRTSRTELPNVIQKLQDDLKKAKKEVEDLKLKIATGAVGSSSNGNEAREIAGVKVLVREAEGLDSNAMRQLSDALLARIKSGVVVVGRRSGDGKVSLIVRSSDDVKQRVPAGQVIKELAPIVGGRGGGKPDMAEGGGSQPEKLKEALEASYNIIERLLVK